MNPPTSNTDADSPGGPDRRTFLTLSGRSLGGGWLALHLPFLGALAACARDAHLNGEPLQLLTPTEARTLEAMVERLIPSVDGIGAREAGAVHFIDLALAGPFEDGAGFFRSGLSELVGDDFADLDEEEQIRYLTGIEDTPFFGFARVLTIFGTFSDPRHGGGREDALHRIYDLPHAAGYAPPFGWYDAQDVE
jgi:gluconate 2-dehydrogenase gamma chain